MYLSTFEAAELKKQLAEKFDLTLHLHDACGAQYFSLDKAAGDEARELIVSFIGNLRGKVTFTEGGKAFTVK